MLNIEPKKAFLIIFIVLFCSSFLVNCWLIYQLSTVLSAYYLQKNDAKALLFTKMFVEDVLMAKEEIDFDTRLSLETAVRNLNDQEVFDQWQAFTKSTTKEGASNEAKALLDLLIRRIGP